MWNKKWIIIYLSTCCILVLVFYVIFLKREIQTIELQVIEMEDKYNAEFCQKMDIISNIYSTYENMNYSLSQDYPVIREDGKEVSLYSIRKDSAIYVRISNLNCWSCIQELNVVLTEYSQQSSKREIIYLVSVNPLEFLAVMKEGLKFIGEIYVTVEKNNLPIESYNEPYLFTIDDKFEIRKLHIPIKGQPNLTQSYLTLYN